MSHSFWLIVIFVATMVCNGSCRPQEIGVPNIQPLHKSVNQPEVETPSRYEKTFTPNQGSDSIAYLRIDIPYKSGNNLKNSEKLSEKNNSKSVIDYVPIALTNKKSHIKKWPSDQNGIESPDDLDLYNIYTNNINPLPTQGGTNQQFNNHFTQTKPSVLILEELTTPKPFFGSPNIFTPQIHVFNKPVRPLNSHPGYYNPQYLQNAGYFHQNMHFYEHFQKPVNRPQSDFNKPQPTTESSHSVISLQIQPPQYVPQPVNEEDDGFQPTTDYSVAVSESAYNTANPSVSYNPPQSPTPTYTENIAPYYPSSSLKPEVTTKKKQNKCPNISIVATNSLTNTNLYKEGCQDVSIHISTNLNNNNSNSVTSKPLSTTSVAQNDSRPQTGIFGIFEVFWSVISRIFSLSLSNPILSTILTPFLTGGIGLSALMLPWSIPHMLWSRNCKQNPCVAIDTDKYDEKPTKYLNQSTQVKFFRLKRSTRRLKGVQAPWFQEHGKKISSSDTSVPATERIVNVSESEKEEKDANIKETKLNIESIATVARASSDGPTLQSSATIDQLFDTVSQMVNSDIRTPPKLKEIIKEKTNENRREALGEEPTSLPVTIVYDEDISKTEDVSGFEVTKKIPSDPSEGKSSNMKAVEGVQGIAIPVVMDEDMEPTTPPKKLLKIPEVPKPVKEEKRKNGVTKPHPTTTPSSGLSTWILLSDNREVTTPSSKKNNNNNKKENEEKKKNAGGGSTTKKPAKTQTTNLKSSTAQPNKKTTLKLTSAGGKKPESDPNSMSALEAMVKNQKKFTTTKPKTNDDSKNGQKKPTDPKKKFPDRLEVAESKDKFETELPDSKTTFTLPTNLIITTDTNFGVSVTDRNNQQTVTESSVEETTKKKKLTSKKKKKNKNRRRKPASETGVEVKTPPPQPVGSQIYNFLSREIVPTVGLGLIGVALTAGLASFLGYNPFVSSTVPLRRTYESHHGYSPNNYYNYNTDFTDGGQSEEVLFREVLSGMPEDSRYGLTHTDAKYPDTYNRQDTVYDSMKNPVYSTATGSYNSEKHLSNYDSNYPQDYSGAYGSTYDGQDKRYSTDIREKYPTYTKEAGTSFVYPETSMVNSADKASRLSNDYSAQTTGDKYAKGDSETIERQPEALYRVAAETDVQYKNGESTIQGVSSQNSWHRIGSPMEPVKHYPHVEPGPRSLDLNKDSTKKSDKKRSKRDADSVIQKISRKRTKKQNDVENEIDFEDNSNDNTSSELNLLDDFATSTAPTRTTSYYYTETPTTSPEPVSTSTTAKPVKETTNYTPQVVKVVNSSEPTESTETYDTEDEPSGPGTPAISFMDILKRVAQFKLRLGLNFLRSTTDLFSRYLDDIQRRVDESFINTTTVQYNRRKNPWSRIFFSRLNGENKTRKRRSVLEDTDILNGSLTKENKLSERFSKSTKKDLSPSNKIFHQKKIIPKKYKAKDAN